MPTSLTELLVCCGLALTLAIVAVAPRKPAQDNAVKQQTGFVRKLQTEIQNIGE